MDIDDFIERFEDAVEGLEPGTLGADSRYRDLETWDSLAVLTVIAMVDAEYGVSLRAEDFQNNPTLRELADAVGSRAP